MDKAIEVRDGEGAARWFGLSTFMRSSRSHRTFWTGVVYGITIVAILAVAARLY